jgi:hypothetical protein
MGYSQARQLGVTLILAGRNQFGNHVLLQICDCAASNSGLLWVKDGHSGPESQFLNYPEQRTSSGVLCMSQKCQSTKSLRSSPLRG